MPEKVAGGRRKDVETGARAMARGGPQSVQKQTARYAVKTPRPQEGSRRLGGLGVAGHLDNAAQLAGGYLVANAEAAPAGRRRGRGRRPAGGSGASVQSAPR